MSALPETKSQDNMPRNISPKIFSRHASMVLDKKRTIPLKQAIKAVIKNGDIVCDIGSGLGILSFFALSSGAGHVYAVDCDGESLGAAITFAKNKKIDDKITFIEGLSFDVKLDNRVDVIICETVGSAAFDENILATLSDAKRRLLKRGGRIIPKSIELWAAPVCRNLASSKDKLITTGPVQKKQILSTPVKLINIQTSHKLTPSMRAKKNFIIKTKGKLTCIAVWPRINWAKNFFTDASPLKPSTHWKQCLLPIKQAAVKPCDKIRFELGIRPNPASPKFITEITWKINKL